MADGLLAGGSQEEKEEGKAAEDQSLESLRLLWKQECYSQTEVCCSQLAVLESKGIQVQGDHYDPYNYS